MNFWLCIWFGEPIFGYLYFKRYFSAILQIHFGVLLDTEPVSGSGSPIHNLWFGPSLGEEGGWVQCSVALINNVFHGTLHIGF